MIKTPTCSLCGAPLYKGRCINPNCISGITTVFDCYTIPQEGKITESHTISIYGLDRDLTTEFRQSPYLGYVMRIDENTYRIYCEPKWNNSGVDVTQEDYPEFYRLVPAYLEEHPDRLMTAYSDSDSEQKSIERQLKNLYSYLDSTDYIVVKCAENGVLVEDEYPEEYELRQLARAQIEKLRQELESLSSSTS